MKSAQLDRGNAFFHQVSSQFHISLTEALDKFRVVLLAGHKKGHVSEDKIEELCSALKKRISEQYTRNLCKFSMYSERNIFGTAPRSTEISDDEHIQLREKYHSLFTEQRLLQQATKDADALLKDMRAALFTVRIGAQAFDDCEVQPVVDSVEALVTQKQRLASFCSEAKSLVAQLDQSNGSSATMDIDAGDSADISLLSHTIKST